MFPASKYKNSNRASELVEVLFSGGKLFFDDDDRDDFLDRLGTILSDSKTPCFAWSFMTNHFHVLLRTGTVPISTVMRRLLTGYAVSFNRRHRRLGHLFQNRYKSILCQGDFVETVLKAAQENLDRKYRIHALGYDFDWLPARVLGLFGLTFNELLTGGKKRKMVQARSVLCYWGTRELGMSPVSLSKKLNIAPSTGSESAMKGRQIVEEHGWKLLEENKSVNPRNAPNTP